VLKFFAISPIFNISLAEGRPERQNGRNGGTAMEFNQIYIDHVVDFKELKMIYNEQQMAESAYKPVMEKINQLYAELGSPAHLPEGETSVETTGEIFPEYYKNHIARRYTNGDREKGMTLLYAAASMLEKMYEGLNMYGGGGSYYIKRTDAWKSFAEQACQLIDGFHAENDAYEIVADYIGLEQ